MDITKTSTVRNSPVMLWISKAALSFKREQSGRSLKPAPDINVLEKTYEQCCSCEGCCKGHVKTSRSSRNDEKVNNTISFHCGNGTGYVVQMISNPSCINERSKARSLFTENQFCTESLAKVGQVG